MRYNNKRSVICLAAVLLAIIVAGSLVLLLTAQDKCELVTVTSISGGRVSLDNGFSLRIESTSGYLQVGDRAMFFSRRSGAPYLNRYVVGNSELILTRDMSPDLIDFLCPNE